jgi:VWFA-related protein
MRPKVGFAVLLLGVLAGPIPARAPSQNQPEIAAHDEPVTFSSRVNLVSVPVVVRDRNGKALGTLEKDDFRVFDKGKLQAIKKFSIEKNGAGPEAGLDASKATLASNKAANPAQPVVSNSFIAYLVDDVHLNPSDLVQTRQAMNRHLDEALDPAGSAAIFTTRGETLADFTQDREQLHKAVNNLKPWTRGPTLQDCPPIIYYLADLLMNKFMYFSGQTDYQIALLVMDKTGDKSLVDFVLQAEYCSGIKLVPPPKPPPPGVPPPPPPDEPLIQFVKGAVHQALDYGERETSMGLTALNDTIRKLSVMPGSRNLVLVSPGFLLTIDHRTDESDVFDRAIRANVIINSIDMRGLFAIIPGADVSEGGFHATNQFDAEAALRQADILAEMADGTGGTYFHNNNDLKKGLNLSAARPEYVYVLGFSPEALKPDGTFHALKVSLKNSADLTIQARRGYWAPKHAVDPVQAAKDLLQETFFSNEEIAGLPLDLQTSFFKFADEKFDLSVTSRLDIKGLRFKKADGRNDDTLTVVAGLFDASGKNVVATRKVVNLHLRDQNLATLQNVGIRLKENFSVAPGRYIVRVVVTDSEGQSITARNGSVQIP